MFRILIALILSSSAAWTVEVLPSAADSKLIEDIFQAAEQGNADALKALCSDGLDQALTDEVVASMATTLAIYLTQPGHQVVWLSGFNRGPGKQHYLKVSAPEVHESLMVQIYIENGQIGGLFYQGEPQAVNPEPNF